MVFSFIRALACFPSRSADYGLLEAEEQVSWPNASFPQLPGPIVRLPPELVQLIVRCGDSTMLATCSLVCAQWMAHARPLMFSRISISMANANRFARLFASPGRATFGSYVREVELDELIIGDFFISDVLPKFIVNFTHLDTLTLCAVPNWLPRAFQVVTHLELNFSLTKRLSEDPHRLTGFISLFPRLESLKLAQEYGAFLRFNTPSDICRPPTSLRRVELDNPLLLPWITSGTPQPRIAALRLDISSADSLKALESLRCLSPSLRSLDLILSDLEVGASFLTKHHLDPNTQLHSLRIQADHSQAAQILLTILSYIDTSSLSEISLDFAIPYLDSPVLTLLPWGALDAALAALPALRRLMVVKVLVSPHGWRSRINQRTVLLDAVNCMPLCRDFGFGVGVAPPESNSRPPSRAAGSRRYLTDLHAL
ncbi:hypothetical protein C8F04DRAFT_1086373 [Mycena alexandri]|uniref:F-box domain-containing protein n=1 Tax=Mycena alexandri TaxID=1745969 RepID=A0AAD6X505_9AGAR|nr:hypothetical protein C8F04DRAFT_1086373 [Mycena alexandri]